MRRVPRSEESLLRAFLRDFSDSSRLRKSWEFAVRS